LTALAGKPPDSVTGPSPAVKLAGRSLRTRRHRLDGTNPNRNGSSRPRVHMGVVANTERDAGVTAIGRSGKWAVGQRVLAHGHDG
jgi:hypothetical protein